MAGESQAAQAPGAFNPEDYELGDTNLDMRTASGLPEEKPPQARLPDGTFAPPNTPAEPETPAAPKHPPYVVEMAREYGYSDDEINAVSTDILGRSIAILRRRDRDRQAQLSAEYQIQNPRQPAPPPPQPVEPEIDLGLDERQYGPEMIGALKKVRKDSLAENDKLKAEIAAMRAEQAAAHQTAFANHMDAAFELLGDNYDHVYGKGVMSEVEAADQVASSRRIETLKAIVARDKVNLLRLSPKALAAKIKSIADPLYKIQAAPPPASALADPYAAGGVPTPGNGHGARRFTEDQWNNGGVSSPSARKGAAEPKGEELARQNLAKRQREQGTLGSTPSQSELDGFLG